MSTFCEHTPIEEYTVAGVPVFVKREDRYGVFPSPPLGKLRGLRPLLSAFVKAGHRTVGCWDSRVSRLGEGLAAAAREFPGVRAIVSYPVRRGVAVPPSIAMAEALGAEIHPIRGNVTPICYAQARRYVHSQDGVILPFGLDCEVSVQAVAAEAARTPAEVIRNGTLILCAGSGVTLAGLLRGLPAMPNSIIALSSGRATRNIWKCVGRYIDRPPTSLKILDPLMPYYDCPTNTCPFPSHPNYDLKAWKLLTENVHSYRLPILFWNIGA